ncbi:MAG: right-handed parallel beta-helix repeat-containing protein [Flavobacteriales bacterium]|nr:right-handed parallel beta-helix repeat-containing protein [Flavobacteriales bacterium]
MSRSARGRSVGPLPWIAAAAVVAALFFLLLRFVDTDHLAGRWPLGIRAAEVDAYAGALEWRMDSTAARAERYLISSAAGQCPTELTGAGWSRHWFEADGFGDSVRVRRLRTARGGFVLKFNRNEPFHAQRHIVLVPATWQSIRAKYLEIIAEDLGLQTPEVSFVRVIACGRDLGLFLKEERIDADFLEKRGLAGASLAEQGHLARRPDHLFPAFNGDSTAQRMVNAILESAYDDIVDGERGVLPYVIDAGPASSLALMALIEHGQQAFANEHLLAYDWSRGRLVPLYRHARAVDEEMPRQQRMLDALTATLREPLTREAIRAGWLRLADESWRLRERFAAMDRAWLPILSEGGSLRMVQARAMQMQEELIGRERLAQDPLEQLDAALVRYAGGGAFAPARAANRYWPGAEDERILRSIADRTRAFVRGDTLVFPRGTYTIAEDLTVPYGHAVVMEEGARLEIAAGASVMVQGPLAVRGTRRNPVFIRPADAQAFGVFAVVGDGSFDVRIAGLQMSGGSEARMNGVYFSGMLAVHGAATTVLENCIISGSGGEDLVNVKGGLVELRDCVFEDGFADLVDLDRCIGSVSGCVFRSGRADANGDGLDVSGARVRVVGCAFERMMDKGISVGEASQLLVMDSRFEGNRLALASKDLSVAYVSGNTFRDNGIVFGAYRKKPIYGGARVMRYANAYEGNTRDQEVDDLSAVVARDTLEEATLRMFE